MIRPTAAAAPLLALLALAAPVRGAAQNAGTVEGLAPILAAEDARRFDGALFAGALRSPDSVVQRYALRALGRIGDPAAVPLLAEYLAQPDSTLDAEAAFALGLIRDTSAVAPLISWLTGPQPIGQDASQEGATALARIGGPTAAAFVARVLVNPSGLRMPDPGAFQQQLLAEAWRLGRRAPIEALMDASGPGQKGVARYYAAYSLTRLHPREAATLLLALGRDQNPSILQMAVRVLTRAFADSAGIPRDNVARVVAGALGDQDPFTRIAALRALATFGDSGLAVDVLPLTDDPVGNVQVQALDALGRLGGSRAADRLAAVAGGDHPWAMRRQALLSLSRVDSAAFRRIAASWSRSGDWRDRMVAATGWGTASPGRYSQGLLADPDGRVVAAALQAWADATRGGGDSLLLAAARRHLADADAAVRSVAADIIARAPSPSDLLPLEAAWRRSQRDSFPDAGESALGAIKALSATPGGRDALRFAATVPAPATFGYLYRGWAERHWDALSDHWGPSTPITTGRSLEDYRSIARRYIVGAPEDRSPHVTVELEGNGSLDLALFAADAPLTVANFLRLVDAGYFNGMRWHRVVPGFVVQTGDPRGDGWGGPGTVIRDEINRHRYRAATVGMALSGPDTGGSQWFITLDAEPHLDGTYTVFGEVAAGTASLNRIVQGDLIRSIHR